MMPGLSLAGTNWTLYPNFTIDEMRCKCGCGRADMNSDFMEALQRVRDALGRPMRVTSGFRCPEHDKAIGGAGVHPTGQATDIAVSGTDAYHLLSYAMDLMTGVGLKQHGPHDKRFVHLDTTIGPARPWIWTYT